MSSTSLQADSTSTAITAESDVPFEVTEGATDRRQTEETSEGMADTGRGPNKDEAHKEDGKVSKRYHATHIHGRKSY